MWNSCRRLYRHLEKKTKKVTASVVVTKLDFIGTTNIRPIRAYKIRPIVRPMANTTNISYDETRYAVLALCCICFVEKTHKISNILK